MLHLTKCFPKTHLLEDTCPSSSESTPPTLGHHLTPRALALAVAPLCSLLGLGFVSCGTLLNPWGVGFVVGFSLKARCSPAHTAWLWTLSFPFLTTLNLPAQPPAFLYRCYRCKSSGQSSGVIFSFEYWLHDSMLRLLRSQMKHCVLVLALCAE